MKIKIFLSGLLLLTNLGETAFAERISKILIAGARDGNNEVTTRPIDTTLAEPYNLYAIVVVQEGSKKTYYGDAKSIVVEYQSIPLKPFPEKDTWTLQWYKIEPNMFHVDRQGHDPANPDFLWYTNAGAPGGRTDS